MIQPSQPYSIDNEIASDLKDTLCELTGLRQYSSHAQAIVSQNCDDAVHVLYPEILKQQARLFLDQFKGRSLYAVKSNPHSAVLKLLWSEGVRDFEVASLREVKYVLDLLPEARLYFMHPVKSRQAIRGAAALGVRHFAFDGLEELQKIEAETGDIDGLELFLRVRNDQESAAYPLSGKFGSPVKEASLLLRRAKAHAAKVGITFHVGSQCMNAVDYAASIGEIAEMLKVANIRIDMLDIGGGFPVYYPGMAVAPLTDYFKVIEAAIVQAGLEDLTILCEPGRALIAEAGAVAVRVELRKNQVLYLNDGTYGSLFDAGASGWAYPLEVYGKDGSLKKGALTQFKLFGPTCDSLDVMEGPFDLDETIEEGDWVLFKNLGAYGYAMQTRFNGFYSETVVMVDKGLAE